MANSEKKDQVQVIFLASSGDRDKWKDMAKKEGLTLTGLIKKLLDGHSGEEKVEIGEQVKTKAEIRAEEKRQEELDNERIEMMETLMDASQHCWPCGEIRKVTKAEKLAGKFAAKIKWVDEAGLCYDEDMYCWEADGKYNAKKQVGAGMLTWMRTIGPALQEGWRPKEPMSVLTAKRVLHAYEGIEGQDQEFIQKLQEVIKKGEQNNV